MQIDVRRAGDNLRPRHPQRGETRDKRGKIRQEERRAAMVPLYEEPCFTFRFAEDRLIPRFHLEGVPAGQPVSVFWMDPSNGKRLDLLARATVGQDGWVDLAAPITVRSGQGFVVVLDSATVP
jgi:hypothetical protein